MDLTRDLVSSVVQATSKDWLQIEGNRNWESTYNPVAKGKFKSHLKSIWPVTKTLSYIFN